MRCIRIPEKTKSSYLNTLNSRTDEKGKFYVEVIIALNLFLIALVAVFPSLLLVFEDACSELC